MHSVEYHAHGLRIKNFDEKTQINYIVRPHIIEICPFIYFDRPKIEI